MQHQMRTIKHSKGPDMIVSKPAVMNLNPAVTRYTNRCGGLHTNALDAQSTAALEHKLTTTNSYQALRGQDAPFIQEKVVIAAAVDGSTREICSEACQGFCCKSDGGPGSCAPHTSIADAAVTTM
jgi:hypothetical protein